MMKRNVMFFGLLVCALLAAQNATAQEPQPDGAAVEPLPIPADWRERSGVEVGLEIRNIAELEGQPFDAKMLDVRDRPALGLDIVQRGRNLLVLEDNDGSLRRSGFGGQAAWQQVLRTVYTLYPDRFDMVMALTEWQEQSAFAYYLPLANNVTGIGYQHLTGRQVFNQTGSNLDGLIFMNDYRLYLGRNAVFGRVVFLQEIGHRWGAFPFYANSPTNGRDMLGRDDSHWSYFMHSANSALEGNSWRDNGNGSFTTETNAFGLTSSPLDRHLMGFLPPNEVEDWFLILDPDVRGQRDDFGRLLNAASGPAFQGRATVNGGRHNITIDDVMRSEGARNPSFANSQKVWNVATVLILNQGSSWDASKHATAEALIDSWEEMFEEEVGGAADLIMTLEDNPQPPASDFGDACTSTGDCNPDNSTVCLTTDDGRICSKRCDEASECGAGFCCAEDFCYPSGDSACEGEIPEGEVCTDDRDCGFGCCIDGECGECEDDNDPEDRVCTEGGFVVPCDNNAGFVNGTSSQSGCQTPAGAPGNAALLLLMALMAMAVRRQRA